MTELENDITRNGVRNETQLRTQRRVKVNAQITFILWLIESVMNIVIIISMFAGSLGQTTFTLNMILFLIILPYSYLNNTSHNKSRIAEEGWLNILRNILPCAANKGRTDQTRVYVISNGPFVRSSDKNILIVIGTTLPNESHPQTADNPELQHPIQEGHGDATGNAEQGQRQTGQVALQGRRHAAPYSPLSPC